MVGTPPGACPSVARAENECVTGFGYLIVELGLFSQVDGGGISLDEFYGGIFCMQQLFHHIQKRIGARLHIMYQSYFLTLQVIEAGSRGEKWRGLYFA